MGKISNTESVEPLIAAINDDNTEINLYGITALGEIGD